MSRFSYITVLTLLLFCALSDVSGSSEEYVSSSVLSSGKWFRMEITSDGIYRIDYTLLKQLGLENPSNPRIYGNNTGQMSYYNDRSHPDDLSEIAIYLEKGNDGIFNEGDYLLFYGQRTHRWLFDQTTNDFRFLRHNYSDTSAYFITSGPVPGKKMAAESMSTRQPDLTSTASDIFFIYEQESENLIHSGREWYQPVSYTKDTEIDPGFRDIITSEKIRYQIKVLARAPVSTLFRFTENGSELANIPVGPVIISSTTGMYAQSSTAEGDLTASSAEPVFKLSFINNGEISAKGWIDYVKLIARKPNLFDGTTTHYTDSRSTGPGTVTEFSIKSSSGEMLLWDVTDPYSAKTVPYLRSGENITFRLTTDSVRTFVAFSVKNVGSPYISSIAVKNQNLHASPEADLVVVTHPIFRSYAERLAALHMENSGLLSLVVTPEEVYNEFSGGIPDITAIRNFLRMKFLRQKDSDHPLKYLLLFGDGSFDNKTLPPGNTNYIPTFQTISSTGFISSFTSDDFYGLLEDGEGEESGTEDLGIGRITAADTTEASVAVSKITNYLDPAANGNWKNLVCITADDEDGNTHLFDAEGLAELIEEKDPWINIDKIYFDSFNQVTTSSGQFYPDVTQAINDRINSGTLIFNYIGHGNENSLGHERVVTPESIDQWKNKSKLPLFITATCEFSRFDDININPVTGFTEAKYSSGEKILFSGEGGAVALMSTTRLVYAAPNYTLNRNIIDVAFDRDNNGNALRLGDIIRIAKNRSGNNTNKRSFLLLGDPALRLCWPSQGNIVTDSLFNEDTGEVTDTLKALSLVTVSGHVENNDGAYLDNFNGYIIPIVYGQPRKVETLANDGGSKVDFMIRDNILFSGKVKAINGKFSFTFIMPREIDYSFGPGKISYYASDQNLSMMGSYSGVIIGGFSDKQYSDTTGPVIRLFLNDTLFREGGITDMNPKLLAFIEDAGGINTTGTAIGHDILCWLDNDRSESFILNNYYQNDFGAYNKGKLVYSLPGLSQGSHTVTLKVWDNFNNSSEQSLSFFVSSDEIFILKNLLNYPNPFATDTKISAEHNRPDEVLNISVAIYGMNGEIIRIINLSSPSTGYQLEPVDWDGRTSNGSRCARGIYPYKVTVTTEGGETATVSGRMIIY